MDGFVIHVGAVDVKGGLAVFVFGSLVSLVVMSIGLFCKGIRVFCCGVREAWRWAAPVDAG